MRNYLIKTPRILKAAYLNCIWEISSHANSIYLTFDDGPHPEITPFVLEQLEKYNAKATFFCIGDNVEKYPDVYQQIIDKGHSIGNHTQHHLNGFNTENITYLKDISLAAKQIKSNMFRPPYGRITYAQMAGIKRLFPQMKIIMWDVLSGDFDTALKPQACFRNVRNTAQPGSIIVFHDSEKAWKRLKHTLPLFLKHCEEKKWTMKKINL